ncbi:uncharacterized protein A4U43_C05F4070 [Asparagus officinalis]|uniref:Uncharacterized protein n=1 Tax=Asparagus officinalis TaxID=4686 RepID=A0A5P1EP70_ASPOF|nr:uncharacterized protein LOC109841485 [Asparagus officinalis]ONK67815.1 uncharacterized protein A4U43_C05F4070 [Asparagus officinalis]
MGGRRLSSTELVFDAATPELFSSRATHEIKGLVDICMVKVDCGLCYYARHLFVEKGAQMSNFNPTSRASDEQEGVHNVQIQKAAEKAVEKYIEKHGKEYYDNAVKTKHGLYHVLFEIVAMLNEESGPVQFELPSIETLETAYKEVTGGKGSKLTKDEFRRIIEKVVRPDCFHVGQGAKDLFLYIFGVPVLALLAKRVIPGPTRAVSDDVFIPLTTTATVVYLAKTNRL